MNAAAEVFSVRHVCMFGNDVPEGMAALDDIVFAAHPLRSIQDRDPRRANIITFDVTADGLRAVPRTQMQVIAGGLAVFLESGISPGVRLLSAVMPSSFAGVCASTVTWLLSGGSLTFHHPFDAETLKRQLIDEACETLIAPAPLALRLGEAGAFADAASSLQQVIGLWRTAEQVASSNTWNGPARFSDLYAFGEAGLFALPRDADGGAAPMLPGSPLRRNRTSSAAASEAFVTKEGTLGLRGAMIPIAAYAPQRRPREGAPVRLLPDHVEPATRHGSTGDGRDLHHRATLRCRERRRLPLSRQRSQRLGTAPAAGRHAHGPARSKSAVIASPAAQATTRAPAQRSRSSASIH